MEYNPIKTSKYAAVIDALSSWLGEIDHPGSTLNFHDKSNRKFYLDQQIAALCAIDSEIQKEISARRQELNLLAPINTLPHELLSMIFRLAWTSDIHRDEAYHNIELVCIRWFTIIRATPQLFDKLGLRWNAKVIAEAEEGAPLDIICNRFNKGFLDLIEPSVHRWRTFEAQGPILEGLTTRCFRRPAPLLKSFHMRSLDLRAPLPVVSDNEDMFAGQAPSLVDLRLDGVFLSWDSAILRRLQILHIMIWDGSQVPTTLKICHVLAACPTLQRLRLVGQAMAYFPEVAMDTIPVQLTLLHHLELIELPRNTFRGLLSSLVAPSLRSLNIEATFISERDVSLAFEDLPENSLLPMFLSSMNAANITRNLYRSNFVRIAATGDRPSSKFMWRVQVNSSWDLEPLPNTLRYFLNLGRQWVKSLRTLCLSGIGEYCFPATGIYTLEEALHRLVSLESLVMEDHQGDLGLILKALGSSPGASEGTSLQTGWPCPNLRVIRFENGSYVRLVHLLGCVRSRYGRQVAVAKLPDNWPAPLKDLAVQNSFIIDRQLHDAEDMMKEIREIVGEGVFAPGPDLYDYNS